MAVVWPCDSHRLQNAEHAGDIVEPERAKAGRLRLAGVRELPRNGELSYVVCSADQRSYFSGIGAVHSRRSPVCNVLDSGDMEGTMGGTALVIAMCFPGLQLVSAFLTLILFACWPRPDKSRQLKQLAKITGGVVAGTIAGILLMIGIGYAMEAFGF